MVSLVRRVRFSSGHRYWLAGLSAGENRARFGRWASPYNHGHNYVLDVTVAGEVDPSNGMVVNMTTLNLLLQRKIVSVFDQKSINDEVPGFDTVSPSLENILSHIYRSVFDEKPSLILDGKSVILESLRLEETPFLWGTFEPGKPMKITKCYEFSASHRLHVPDLSGEENIALFGKCNNPNGHGHNYGLEVTISGEPNPLTGMLIDIEALDECVHQEVVDRYDHKSLSLDIPEFQGRNATTEIVAQEIFDRLEKALAAEYGATLAKVVVRETERNSFEVSK